MVTCGKSPIWMASRANNQETIMAYVDGYVLPVPSAKIDDYKRIARKAGKVWKEHGALAYVEAVAEDVKPGKRTSFPQAVKLKEDEVVVFAYVLFRSRAHRDKVKAKAMDDPRLAGMSPKDMPFDGKRMIWGGFQPFVQL